MRRQFVSKDGIDSTSSLFILVCSGKRNFILLLSSMPIINYEAKLLSQPRR
jgi:hypothetical protein